QILQLVHDALPEVDPVLANAMTKEAIDKLLKAAPDGRYARNRRKQMFIENLRIQYAKNIDDFKPPDSISGVETSGGGGGGDYLSAEGAGGGRVGGSGRGAAPQGGEVPPGESAGASAPGFWVSFNVRLLYGDQNGDAVDFISKTFYPQLQKLVADG